MMRLSVFVAVVIVVVLFTVVHVCSACWARAVAWRNRGRVTVLAKWEAER